MTRVDDEVPDRLAYSIDEVARLLSVSESTVKRMLAAGTLKAVKVGGHRRIPRSELYRLLEPTPTEQAEAK